MLLVVGMNEFTFELAGRVMSGNLYVDVRFNKM